MFSTSGGISRCMWGYHEYLGDTMSTSGDIMSTSGDIMMHAGDTMSTLGDTMSTLGGYHEYIGGYSVHQGHIMMHVGEQVDKSLSISIENPNVLNISRCAHHIPSMY